MNESSNNQQPTTQQTPNSINATSSPIKSARALLSPSGPKPSVQELQFVQNLIEKCLVKYLNEREIVTALFEAGVEPAFAAVVLQKLQDQNPAFFKAYNVRLQLKEQVEMFNSLLVDQVIQMQLGIYLPLTSPPEQPTNPNGISPQPALSPSTMFQLQRPHSSSTPPAVERNSAAFFSLDQNIANNLQQQQQQQQSQLQQTTDIDDLMMESTMDPFNFLSLT